MKTVTIVFVSLLIGFIIGGKSVYVNTKKQDLPTEKSQSSVIKMDNSEGVNVSVIQNDDTSGYYVKYDVQNDIKSIDVITRYSKSGTGTGRIYNDLKKINSNQYLFLGKDYNGETFDSTIITINYQY